MFTEEEIGRVTENVSKSIVNLKKNIQEILPNQKLKFLSFSIPYRSERYCYIATACTSNKGLPKNCLELTTLRNFRDNYLNSVEGGKELIKNYYSTAPKIVQCINQDSSKDRLYDEIFEKIKRTVKYIQNNQFVEAIETSTKMVNYLENRFQIKP